MSKKTFLFPLLIIISTLICYANVINAPFIWDDEIMVVANPFIRNLANIPKIFTSSAFGHTLSAGKFYRPFQILSFAFDYHFWGLNPMGFHITSIILHIINCLLLFYLLIKLKFSKLFSYIVTQVFAIHPIHIEAVTYISGRGDLLYLTFSLLCFICFIIGSEKKSIIQHILASLLLIIAIISKENSVSLPVIILLYVFLFQKRNSINKSQIYSLISLNLISFCYAMYRVLPLSNNNTTLSLIADSSFWERLITIPHIFITYIRLVFLPVFLHMEYHFVEKSLFSPYILIGIPFLAIFFYLLINKTAPKKQALFFALWFIIGLSPVLNIAAPLASTVREHWLYLPSIGLFILLAKTISQSINKIMLKTRLSSHKISKLKLILFIISILYLSTCTIIRNKDWQEPLKLYEHDLFLEPRSFLLHNNRGVEHFRLNNMIKAKESFKMAVQVSPRQSYGIAHNNLGVIYQNEDNIELAKTHFLKSIECNNYELAYTNLANIFIKENKLEDAISHLEAGNKIHPNDIRILYKLGLLYYYTKQPKKSKALLTKLNSLHPNYNNVSEILRKLF
jgi:protein O-mannosyl-transferase